MNKSTALSHAHRITTLFLAALVIGMLVLVKTDPIQLPDPKVYLMTPDGGLVEVTPSQPTSPAPGIGA